MKIKTIYVKENYEITVTYDGTTLTMQTHNNENRTQVGSTKVSSKNFDTWFENSKKAIEVRIKEKNDTESLFNSLTSVKHKQELAGNKMPQIVLNDATTYIFG